MRPLSILHCPRKGENVWSLGLVFSLALNSTLNDEIVEVTNNFIRPFSFSFLFCRLEFYISRYVITICLSKRFQDYRRPRKVVSVAILSLKKKRTSHTHFSSEANLPCVPVIPLPVAEGICGFSGCVDCRPFTPKSTNTQWFSKCYQIHVFPFY